MNELSFAAYTIACVLGFTAQLAFALREWRTLGRRQPMFVDGSDVRVERYFGLAFRRKLEGWLQGHRRVVAPGVAVIDKPREEIWIHDALVVPAGGRYDAIVVADTLETGYGCALLREVYTRLDCRLGPGSVAQALASDGDVRIGRGARVVRWLDAAGSLVIEPQCRVLGRATAGRRLILHPGARVSSAHAPEIVTAGGDEDPPAVSTSAAAARAIVLSDADDGWQAVRATGHRRRLAPDCVAYEGSLVLPAVAIRINLVVHGDLMIGPGSRLDGDVKATGTIRVGAGTVCGGNLVADRDVHLAAATTFHGVIFAQGAITMATGVTGSRNHPGVAVYGADDVLLAPGVTIHGKVASGASVIVTGGERG
jgi:predicted acyltransferase (DUF342 family)